MTHQPAGVDAGVEVSAWGKLRGMVRRNPYLPGSNFNFEHRHDACVALQFLCRDTASSNIDKQLSSSMPPLTRANLNRPGTMKHMDEARSHSEYICYRGFQSQATVASGLRVAQKTSV